jgi:hypothetical protein
MLHFADREKSAARLGRKGLAAFGECPEAKVSKKLP